MSVLQAVPFVQEVVQAYREQASHNCPFDFKFTSENILLVANEEILVYALQKLLDLAFLEIDDVPLSISIEVASGQVCFAFYNPTYVPRSQIMELLFIQARWGESENISLFQLVRHHLGGEITVVSNALIGTTIVLALPKTISE